MRTNEKETPTTPFLLIASLYAIFVISVLRFSTFQDTVRFMMSLQFRGSNIIGIGLFLSSIGVAYSRFRNYHQWPSTILAHLSEIPLAIVVTSSIFHLMDICSIPAVVWLYGDFQIVGRIPYVVDVFMMQQLVLAEFTVLYLVRKRLHWKRLIAAFPFWVWVAFASASVFGTTTIRVNWISYVVAYIPLWLSFLFIVNKIVKRVDE